MILLSGCLQYRKTIRGTNKWPIFWFTKQQRAIAHQFGYGRRQNSFGQIVTLTLLKWTIQNNSWCTIYKSMLCLKENDVKCKKGPPASNRVKEQWMRFCFQLTIWVFVSSLVSFHLFGKVQWYENNSLKQFCFRSSWSKVYIFHL